MYVCTSIIRVNGSYDLLPSYSNRVSRFNVHEASRRTIDRNYPMFARQAPILDKKSKQRKLDSGKSEQQAVAEQKVEEARTMREEGNAAAATAKKVGVHREFFRQLRAIFKVIVANLSSKKVFLFVLYTAFLVLRTYLSILVARLDDEVVRDLI